MGVLMQKKKLRLFTNVNIYLANSGKKLYTKNMNSLVIHAKNNKSRCPIKLL